MIRSPLSLAAAVLIALTSSLTQASVSSPDSRQDELVCQLRDEVGNLESQENAPIGQDGVAAFSLGGDDQSHWISYSGGTLSVESSSEKLLLSAKPTDSRHGATIQVWNFVTSDGKRGTCIMGSGKGHSFGAGNGIVNP